MPRRQQEAVSLYTAFVDDVWSTLQEETAVKASPPLSTSPVTHGGTFPPVVVSQEDLTKCITAVSVVPPSTSPKKKVPPAPGGSKKRGKGRVEDVDSDEEDRLLEERMLMLRKNSDESSTEFEGGTSTLMHSRAREKKKVPSTATNSKPRHVDPMACAATTTSAKHDTTGAASSLVKSQFAEKAKEVARAMTDVFTPAALREATAISSKPVLLSNGKSAAAKKGGKAQQTSPAGPPKSTVDNLLDAVRVHIETRVLDPLAERLELLTTRDDESDRRFIGTFMLYRQLFTTLTKVAINAAIPKTLLLQQQQKLRERLDAVFAGAFQSKIQRFSPGIVRGGCSAMLKHIQGSLHITASDLAVFRDFANISPSLTEHQAKLVRDAIEAHEKNKSAPPPPPSDDKDTEDVKKKKKTDDLSTTTSAAAIAAEEKKDIVKVLEEQAFKERAVSFKAMAEEYLQFLQVHFRIPTPTSTSTTSTTSGDNNTVIFNLFRLEEILWSLISKLVGHIAMKKIDSGANKWHRATTLRKALKTFVCDDHHGIAAVLDDWRVDDVKTIYDVCKTVLGGKEIGQFNVGLQEAAQRQMGSAAALLRVPLISEVESMMDFFGSFAEGVDMFSGPTQTLLKGKWDPTKSVVDDSVATTFVSDVLGLLLKFEFLMTTIGVATDGSTSQHAAPAAATPVKSAAKPTASSVAKRRDTGYAPKKAAPPTPSTKLTKKPSSDVLSKKRRKGTHPLVHIILDGFAQGLKAHTLHAAEDVKAFQRRIMDVLLIYADLLLSSGNGGCSSLDDGDAFASQGNSNGADLSETERFSGLVGTASSAESVSMLVAQVNNVVAATVASSRPQTPLSSTPSLISPTSAASSCHVSMAGFLLSDAEDLIHYFSKLVAILPEKDTFVMGYRNRLVKRLLMSPVLDIQREKLFIDALEKAFELGSEAAVANKSAPAKSSVGGGGSAASAGCRPTLNMITAVKAMLNDFVGASSSSFVVGCSKKVSLQFAAKINNDNNNTESVKQPSSESAASKKPSQHSSAVATPLSFQAVVLTNGYYPFLIRHASPRTTNLPHRMQSVLDGFTHFYRTSNDSGKNSKKKLSWVHRLGVLTLRVHFPMGEKDITMNTTQAAILIVVDDHQQQQQVEKNNGEGTTAAVTLVELCRILMLTPKQLMPHLLTLLPSRSSAAQSSSSSSQNSLLKFADATDGGATPMKDRSLCFNKNFRTRQKRLRLTNMNFTAIDDVPPSNGAGTKSSPVPNTAVAGGSKRTRNGAQSASLATTKTAAVEGNTSQNQDHDAQAFGSASPSPSSSSSPLFGLPSVDTLNARRRAQLDTTIVRIMKNVTRCRVSDLVARVVASIRTTFPCSNKEVTARVKELATREYLLLCRDDDYERSGGMIVEYVN